jgi:hypothetical protein
VVFEKVAKGFAVKLTCVNLMNGTLVSQKLIVINVPILRLTNKKSRGDSGEPPRLNVL